MNYADENYLEFIKNINSELGISIRQIIYRGYEVFNEEKNLKLYDLNQNGIEIYLESETFKSFNEMKTLALSNSVNLQVQSGFRCVQKQSLLWKSKLSQGLRLKEIFYTLMPPGFSEHHTGTTIDFSYLNTSRVSNKFKNTIEFDWLIENAENFGFSLSYPNNNSLGLSFEPWHWKYDR